MPRASASVLACLALVLAFDLSAGPLVKGRRWRRQDARNPLDSLSEPGELATLAGFLERMGYERRHVDEGAGYVVVRVRGRNGIYSLFVVPQKDLIHLRIPELVHLDEGDADLERLHRRLLELNWVNLLGKYSWDARDGEVRFAHTMAAPDGVSFNVFALTTSLLLRIVDQDLPSIRSAAGGAEPGGSTPSQDKP